MDTNDTENGDEDWCSFCLIASGQDEKADVLRKNTQLVCFRDICPAAPHHYQVVPVRHIKNCYSLHSGHIKLVEDMAEMGRAVLRDQGVTDMTDIRLGFHQPPYTSVDHLHLHVLAPARKKAKEAPKKCFPSLFCGCYQVQYTTGSLMR
ncbi:adenosine 5'-monophosphoramidase HINT3-like isoform X2 [Dunckerocampus dactyliophorus]|uniref:adenosine 5'-monophosphoramidase HINT3-like isoform X2 n=1 Tax=Dunckerocampus dactyliophorus TaxID=161453 RepID=UPI002404ADBA|nr:adenosine 5'-monophosphoramidase HINT3-like isoform X2 [Dunckerocampus dactyliophorus]